MHPKVTVLIVTYNRANFLGRAIESVREQSFKDWELIVADDGSTDNTKDIVAEFAAKDSRVRHLSLSHAGRIAIVSNAGIRESKGEYIAILDDDDWWIDPGKLQSQVNFLDTHSEYVGCGGGIVTVNERGEETGRVLKPQSDEDIKRRMLYANPMANLTCMFRKLVAEKIGMNDETMLQFADWDFWLKMGNEGKLYNFPEYFAAYRMWDKGMSFAKQREISQSAWRIVLRHRGKYSGFARGILFASSYWVYARLPSGLKRALNAPLSRLKKALFSK